MKIARLPLTAAAPAIETWTSGGLGARVAALYGVAQSGPRNRRDEPLPPFRQRRRGGLAHPRLTM